MIKGVFVLLSVWVAVCAWVLYRLYRATTGRERALQERMKRGDVEAHRELIEDACHRGDIDWHARCAHLDALQYRSVEPSSGGGR